MSKVYYSLQKIDESLEFDEKMFSANVSLHIKKYKNKNAFQQSFQAWKLLDEIVQKVFNKPLKEYNIKFSDRGKPYCDEFYFSISHVDEYVAVALSKEPCGIDIEKIEEGRNIGKIASSVLGYNENISNVEFYKLWTSTEAVAKLFDISVFE